MSYLETILQKKSETAYKEMCIGRHIDLDLKLGVKNADSSKKNQAYVIFYDYAQKHLVSDKIADDAVSNLVNCLEHIARCDSNDLTESYSSKLRNNLFKECCESNNPNFQNSYAFYLFKYTEYPQLISRKIAKNRIVLKEYVRLNNEKYDRYGEIINLLNAYKSAKMYDNIVLDKNYSQSQFERIKTGLTKHAKTNAADAFSIINNKTYFEEFEKFVLWKWIAHDYAQYLYRGNPDPTKLSKQFKDDETVLKVFYDNNLNCIEDSRTLNRHIGFDVITPDIINAYKSAEMYEKKVNDPKLRSKIIEAINKRIQILGKKSRRTNPKTGRSLENEKAESLLEKIEDCKTIFKSEDYEKIQECLDGTNYDYLSENYCDYDDEHMYKEESNVKDGLKKIGKFALPGLTGLSLNAAGTGLSLATMYWSYSTEYDPLIWAGLGLFAVSTYFSWNMAGRMYKYLDDKWD